VPISRPEATQLKDFGANVRRERNAKAITQEHFAEMVDLNIRTVQKIEAGEINILLTTAVRIQKALRCPWPRLLPVH